MNKTVDQLIVEIKAETAGLRKGLDRVNKRLDTANKKGKQSILTFGTLAKVFVAFGAMNVAGSIVSTARQFEDLQATLEGVTGSAESAKASFDLIKQFTATTTFQVENVATAFTTLVNAGIAPTSEVLQDFGNFAAGMGKDITQMAQAVFNATTGEMEMLKQFGVIARVEGDKLAVNFRGSKDLIDRDADAIVGFLRKISQESFSDALEKRANTASGAISNLKDAVSITFSAIGEGGLLQVLGQGALALKQLAQDSIVVANIIGNILLKVFQGLQLAVSLVTTNLQSLLLILGAYALSKAPAMATLLLAQAMTTLRKAVVLVRSAMLLLSKNPLFLVFAIAALGVEKLSGSFSKMLDKVKELGEKMFIDLGILDPEVLVDSDEKMDSLNQQIQAMIDKLTGGSLEDGLKKGAEFTEELQQAVTNAANAFTNDFVNGLMEGQNALQSFKDFSRNIVSQIISIFLQMEVVNRILKGIFPNFEGTVGTGIFDRKGKASGGTVQRNTPTLVGERGAEIFVPNTGGTILNNMNTKNAMGGQAVNIYQNVNFSTGIVPTVRAEVISMLPQIAEVTKGAVQESAMRGGSFRRSLIGG